MSRQGPRWSKQELDEEAIQRLEEAIFSARNFVLPSPDLRPRTLEQARDSSRVQAWTNRLTLTLVACMLVWSVAVTAMRDIGKHRDKMAGPFPHEIEQKAQSYPNDYPYENQWRLVDAFQEERGVHGRSLEAPSIHAQQRISHNMEVSSE